MDPWGHLTVSAFGKHLNDGVDVRPTIAITNAHIQMPELVEAIEKGRLVPDDKLLLKDGRSATSPPSLASPVHAAKRPPNVW